VAWEDRRNAQRVRIHWTFTLAAAQRKLRKLDPSNGDRRPTGVDWLRAAEWARGHRLGLAGANEPFQISLTLLTAIQVISDFDATRTLAMIKGLCLGLDPRGFHPEGGPDHRNPVHTLRLLRKTHLRYS